MKREPDFSEARPRRRFLYKERAHAIKESKFVLFFRSPTVAFVVIFALAAVAVLPYWLLHLSLPAPRFDAATSVEISDDGRFAATFVDSSLERFFSKGSIAQFKQDLERKLQDLRKVALDRRRHNLKPILNSINSWLRDRSIIPQVGSVRTQPTAQLQSFAEVNDVSDDALTRYRLSDLARTLEVCDDCGAKFAPERIPAVREFAKQIASLDDLEKKERGSVNKEVAGLNPPLSFGWLYVEGAMWIVEVTFWSFAGVVANTVIGLIISCRAARYSPSEFVLVFPKIFLAPLLALVFVALWSTGLTESKISYLNLPYFLVFSFLLGFGTEDLYGKLRELTALILTPSATLSKKKMDDAARSAPYQYQTPDVKPNALPAARNFKELQTSMSAVIKARLERAVVSRAAAND